ncbi:MAG: hypothetical protein AAF587_26375 [Bacteroidota bacterium]
MTKQVPPLYGRFAFPAIDDFLRRTQLVATHYMGSAEFSSYVTTHNRESFYGLEYNELKETYRSFRQSIRTMATSCSGPDGRSVNINVRFPKQGGAGEGQYVIVTNSRYENDQISQMLLGVWKAKEESEILRDEAIGVLLRELIDLKKKEEEEKKAREAAEIARRIKQANQEKKRAQTKRKSITTIRDKFHFDDKITAEKLVEILQRISKKYLNGAPYNIRLITTDGQSYSNIGLKGLLRFFKKRRALVLKLFMDAATPQGELVDIMLAFGSMARHLNAEVEITATRTKEIQNEIRSALEHAKSFISSSGNNSMIHEMFRFDQETFALERVTKLVSAISTKYLQKESPTAFLSTLRGETYPSLDLRQLQAVFRQHKGQVSFLLFGVNHSLTGRTFSLMFQFEAPGHQPYGSLSMMWGDEDTHRLIRAVIWEQLQLRAYRGAKPLAEKETSKTPATTVAQHPVTPVFTGREFKIKKGTALVTMPLEAYWSETLWVHIQQTLKTIGWNSTRAEALYSKEVLETNWSNLNTVELVIADLTYKHPDVFYKIGIAHTLGKKVILITQHPRDLPGDFRRFPHIVYDNNIHGLQRLAERIIELVRMG